MNAHVFEMRDGDFLLIYITDFLLIYPELDLSVIVCLLCVSIKRSTMQACAR